jgi:hypothetical protein
MTPAMFIPRRCRDCHAPIQEPQHRWLCADCVAKRIDRVRNEDGQK